MRVIERDGEKEREGRGRGRERERERKRNKAFAHIQSRKVIYDCAAVDGIPTLIKNPIRSYNKSPYLQFNFADLWLVFVCTVAYLFL